MIPIKAILILAILSTAIAAGLAVYNVYEDENFAVGMRIVSAARDGNDILVDVEVTFENRMESDVTLERVQVTIFSADKSKVHVQETLIPPQILVPAKTSVTRLFEGIRLTNLDVLESQIIAKVQISWTSGTDDFRMTIERPLDLGSIF